MGFTNNSIAVESVHPEKAKEILKYNYAHQRKLNQNWVKFLANEMREGRFMPTAEIHIMYRNGEPVLVNGQHTCNAIVMYGKPVRVTVRKTSTSEVGQVAMMYAFGHDNGKKRTFTDGLGAYNISEEIGLGNTHTQYLATALRHINSGFRQDSWTSRNYVALTDLLEVIPEWSPYAKMFWDNTPAPSGSLTRVKKTIRKQGFLSVLLVTYKYQTHLARDFWSGIVQTGIDDTDPRWYARRIIEDSIARKAGVHGFSSSMLSRMIAKCWGSFVNGKHMLQAHRIKDIGSETAPIVIVGTPYTGRQPAPPWWPDDN